MAKLPDKFEYDRLELLTPQVSEGTSKSRRNLVVSSFIVVAIYLLDKSLLDLNVFGLRLAGANPEKVLLFAIGLILFWGILFCINGSKDAALNKERRYLLSQDEKLQLAAIERSLSTMGNIKEGNPHMTRKNELERELKTHLDQLERIKSAKRLSITAFVIENALPFILAGMAIYCLSRNILSVLGD